MGEGWSGLTGNTNHRGETPWYRQHTGNHAVVDLLKAETL